MRRANIFKLSNFKNRETDYSSLYRQLVVNTQRKRESDRSSAHTPENWKHSGERRLLVYKG